MNVWCNAEQALSAFSKHAVNVSDLQGCRKCTELYGTVPALHARTLHDPHGCGKCRESSGTISANEVYGLKNALNTR